MLRCQLKFSVIGISYPIVSSSVARGVRGCGSHRVTCALIGGGGGGGGVKPRSIKVNFLSVIFIYSRPPNA